MNLSEGAIILPLLEIPLHRPYGRKVVRNSSPLAAGAVYVEQCVEYLSIRMFSGTTFGKEGCNLLPLCIRKVAWVSLSFHAPYLPISAALLSWGYTCS